MTTDEPSNRLRHGSPVVCGAIGAPGHFRAARVAERLGSLPPLLETGEVTVFGRGEIAVTCRDGTAVVRWSSAGPLPDTGSAWRPAATAGATGVVVDGDDAYLHGSLAGVSPVFVEIDDSSVVFSSSLDALVHTRDRVVEDRDAWADVVAVGAPMRHRTVAEGIERLPPWSVVRPGGRIAATPPSEWPWYETVDRGTGTPGDLVEALRASISELAKAEQRLVPLLSGGWDSRVLAALATECLGPSSVDAWSTSSDTGTTLEQLVAADVASRLGVPHHVVTPRHDDIVIDIRDYAEAVHHLSSFHVWMVPLVNALRDHGSVGCVLDGLGGGIFLDSAFATSAGPIAARFERVGRYAGSLADVLRSEVADELCERARSSFAEVVGGIRHAAGERHELDAYLTRTLPGISLGSHALVASVAPVATPFLDDAVVRAASALPDEIRRDAAAYRAVLLAVRPELARLPTAAELTGPRRAHRRRISSVAAATWYRDHLRTGPLAGFVDPALAAADVEAWQRLLDRTGTQHVIRSLATWSLWLEAHA